MRFGAFKLLVCSIGLCCYSIFAYAELDLRQRQQAAKTDRLELQKQIDSLQKKISASESQYDDIAKFLKNSEEKISQISKILHDYELRNQDLEKSLLKLESSKKDQSQLLKEQQVALAKQLKAQYASGLSPWTAVLSGKDPQDINRDLSYMAYVVRARISSLDKIDRTTKRLNELSQQIVASQAEIKDLQTKSAKERNNLKDQQAEHALQLDKIKDSLNDKQKQAAKLASRDKLLADLIKQLDQEIVKADKAAKERQQALLKEQARKQEAAKKAAEQKAAEQKAAEQKAAEQKAAEQNQAAEQKDSTASTKSIQFEPDGGFPGLKKGLTAPVKGQSLGRFGAQRPEGGVWRGIVLRASEDTNVHAVADGKVVYSSWLSGFGNLLIIDHGQGYLSVYGYNKSNVKDVGDLVAVGETVAKVGATGGQVEPGLYFELRKDGAPINPQLWLKP